MRWKIVPLAFGFSGGPVFAMVRNAYLEYPALVGVCLGVVSGLDFDDTNKVRSVTEAVQSAYSIVILNSSVQFLGKWLYLTQRCREAEL